MDSEYCSMGRWISMIVADACGMQLYEGIDLARISGEDWLTPCYLNDFDNRNTGRTAQELAGDDEFKRVNVALANAARRACEQGPCIIHERGLGSLGAEIPNSLRVLLYNSSMEHRIPRAVGDPTFDLSGMSHDEVIGFIHQQDEDRAAYRNALTADAWGDMRSYDLCIDSDLLGREKCAEIIIAAVEELKLDGDRCKEMVDRVTAKWKESHR